eukprot:6472832-Amphidinium_carterae.1
MVFLELYCARATSCSKSSSFLRFVSQILALAAPLGGNDERTPLQRPPVQGRSERHTAKGKHAAKLNANIGC